MVQEKHELEVEYDEQIQKMLDLATSIAPDAQKCISDGNKSASKRARGKLLELSKIMVPLRKRLLEITKR